MPIHYYLRGNPLPGREQHFMAQVVRVDTVDEEELVKRLAAEAEGLTEAQAEAAMKALFKTVSALLGEGRRVNVAGLAQFYPVLSGKFEGVEDQYDPKRHALGVAAAVGQKLVKQVRSHAKLEKKRPTDQNPKPTFYKETGAHTLPGKIFSGNIGSIKGRRLTIDPKKPDEGVFFVSAENPHRQVRVKAYAVTKPAEVVFQVPDGLGSEQWLLEVRARVRGGKQLRQGRLSAVLESIQRP